ncbi:Structural maintenance of chromosomes protein 6 [Entomortierella lignicola]|nr:Structural maintenance of chromosomes protein 6 [Entomortierella lignicola]
MSAPRKRRIIEEDEEDEEEIYESARIASQGKKDVKGKGVKRTKVQEQSENEDDQEQTMDEEEEEEEVTFREEPEGWDEGNDATIENPQDSTWAERAEREFEKSKSRPGKQGMVAEIGVIELIEMYDFMCHRHLKVPFGPKINFIIGHNGSGKSAILTAIMVCLGGKANATNRAQSLKALIREGASQAEVKLQLRNRGPDAYKPEIYGESVIIERRISRDGASSYKIKSSKGKTISTKREELSAMCDHMNIQIDNPMNVLSQDTARQFLQSSTPEEKYKFFSKGTQLSQLSNDYELIRESIDTMQNTLKGKTDLLPELYELAKAAQARFKDSQQAATLELKVENLKNQVAWAQIEELEKDVKDTEDTLNSLLAKVPAIEKKRAQEEQVILELDEKIQELERTAAEHANSNAPILEKKRQLEHTLREKRSDMKEVLDEEKTVNDEIKELKEQIRNFDQKIEQEMNKGQRNSKSRRAEIEGQIEKLIEDAGHAKRQVAERREVLASLELEKSEHDTRLDVSGIAKGKLKKAVEDMDQEIKNLNAQKQNSLKAFGPSMPEVVNAIQEVTNRKGWRGDPPVGPLGRHVKLRDVKWAPVVESALGLILNAFAVTTDADRNTLSEIVKRYKCTSDILLTKKVLFEYRDKEPASNFLTVNRVLEFDNEWVRRLLIDKNAIESTILIEDRAEADRVTSSGRGGGFPDNVSQCFTLGLFRVGDRQGGSASITMNKYRGPPRLSKNVDQEIQVLVDTQQTTMEDLKSHRQEFSQIQNAIRNISQEITQIKMVIRNLEIDVKSKTRSAEDLKESLEEDEPTNLLAYEESKQQALRQIETMKKQYEPVALRKREISASIEPIKGQIAQLNELIKNQDSSTLRIRTDLDRFNAERQDHLPKVQHWAKKLETEALRAREIEKELKIKTKYLEDSTAKATEYCERVKVTDTTTKLEREIKHIQERLREQELQRGCSLEEIAMDMKRKQDEYKAAKLAIHQLGQFVSHLKTTLHQRLSRWRQFRYQMAVRSKFNFSLRLSERAYSGELDFEHSKKQLNIRVETEDQRSGKAGIARDKDPKSLSGGEKSFSTICLLLALWDSMASSIRCLDEFDVFMDAVNRRISMQMLIGAARESDGVQYILITPQDASSVSPGPDVRVHRLHDPVRNQQTIV